MCGDVYIGCYTDCAPNNDGVGGGGNRDMTPSKCPPGDNQVNGCFHDDNQQTPEKCNAYCKGYMHYGLQAGNECFCSNSYGSM